MPRALHLAHPLVVAAVEDARVATASIASVKIDGTTASPQLQTLRQCRGRLLVAKVGYVGFEPVDRLIVLAAFDADMIAPSLARELLELPMRAAPVEAGAVSDERVGDLVDEAVFLDQEEVESAERVRFDEALGRLERSVEDRVLILRRRYAEVEKKRAVATSERDRALSVDARESAERDLKRLDSEGSELEMLLADLEQRTEDAYRKRRDALTRRRTRPPTVERIINVRFELT